MFQTVRSLEMKLLFLNVSKIFCASAWYFSTCYFHTSPTWIQHSLHFLMNHSSSIHDVHPVGDDCLSGKRALWLLAPCCTSWSVVCRLQASDSGCCRQLCHYISFLPEQRQNSKVKGNYTTDWLFFSPLKTFSSLTPHHGVKWITF